MTHVRAPEAFSPDRLRDRNRGAVFTSSDLRAEAVHADLPQHQQSRLKECSEGQLGRGKQTATYRGRRICGTWAYNKRLEQAYTEWIHSRGNFTHFVTPTFRLMDSAGHRTTQEMVEDAVRNMLRRLACAVHGRRRIKFRPPIRSAVVIDWGWKGNHPHAHLILETPSGMSYEQFSVLIKRCASRVRLLDKEPHIRPYQDAGGARYMVKHGISRMIVSLFDTPYAP
jgi:hypothetical protein